MLIRNSKLNSIAKAIIVIEKCKRSCHLDNSGLFVSHHFEQEGLTNCMSLLDFPQVTPIDRQAFVQLKHKQ